MQDASQTSTLRRWFDTWRNHGLDRLPRGDRRSARILNVAAIITAGASLLFLLFYAAYDLVGLAPVIAVVVVFLAFSATTPLLMARGLMLGTGWLAAAILGALTLISYFLSRESWVHVPLATSFPCGIFLALGMSRLRLALSLTILGSAAALLAEFAFADPSPAVRVDPALLAMAKFGMIASTVGMTVALTYYALLRLSRAEKALAAEHARSERLLDNLLPEKIAARLKDEPDRIIADSIGQATILFADIVDFTPRAASMAPEDLVRFLNSVFTEFDAETNARGLEKIKTIGDAYMIAAGMPDPRDDHAEAVAEMALKMLEITERLSAESGQPVAVRIGLHTGPAVAGVIGTRKFFYDVWSDTVNTAARMESHGEPGRIQITAEAKAALGDAYVCEPRGVVDIKGKGPIETWWLTGRA